MFVLRDVSGTLVHEEEVIDFLPLYHDIAFAAVCGGRLPNDGRWGSTAVEPVWKEGRLAGITVCLAGLCKTYGLAMFAERAAEILLLTGFVKDDDREPDPHLSWTIEVREPVQTSSGARLRSTIRRQPYPFKERAPCPGDPAMRTSGDSRPSSTCGVEGAPPSIQQTGQADLFSLTIAAGLLDELRAASADCLERERADFLTGDLIQGPDGHVSVALLDRIPADVETTSSAVHFGFSGKTFDAARRELERRATGQMILGWHHNHPPPCARQCLMTVPTCGTDNVFFSIADRVVHRRGFVSPYMVALVTGKVPQRRADDPGVRAFGWSDGVIRERAFSVF
jgi:hypothetical protein